MKSFVLRIAGLAFVFLTISKPINAQSPGDIAFVGFSADASDSLAILVINDLDGTETPINIYLTDENWDEGSFANSEGLIQLRISTNVTAGTVITLDDVGSADPVESIGEVTVTRQLALAVSGEQVYALLSSSLTPAAGDFLAALNTDSGSAFDDNDGADGSPTGVIDGTNLNIGKEAIDLSAIGDNDVYGYIGDNDTETRFSDYFNLINNTANWNIADGSNEQILVPAFTSFSTTSTISYSSGSWSNNAGGPNTSGLTLQIEDDLNLNTAQSIGAIHVSPGNTLTVASALTVSGDLEINNGAVAVNAHTTVGGNIDFNGTSGSLTISSGDRLTLTGNVVDNGSATFTISSGGAFVPNTTTSYSSANIQAIRDDMSETGYSYLSSPMLNEGASGKPNEYYFDPSSAGGNAGDYGEWIKINNGDLNVEGRGFLAYRENSKTFVGAPVNDAVTVSISGTDAGDGRAAAERGWNLVGNPYTFPIDIAKFTEYAGNSINATIYLWDATLNGGEGAYETSNFGTIPTGQAFFVQADDNETEITFDPSMIAGTGLNTTDIYRMIEQPKLTLNFAAGTNTYNRVKYIFNENYTIERDRYDAYAFGLGGDDFEVGSYYHEELFAVVSLPDISQAINIPIRAMAAKDEQVEVSVMSFEHIPEGVVIELVNRQTGEVFMLAEDAVFNTNIRVGTEMSAFELRFNPATVSGLNELNENAFEVFAGRDHIKLRVFDPEIKKGQVNVWSVDGRLLESSYLGQIEPGVIRLNSSSTGLLIVQAITNKGTSNKRIFKY